MGLSTRDRLLERLRQPQTATAVNAKRIQFRAAFAENVNVCGRELHWLVANFAGMACKSLSCDATFCIEAHLA